MESPQIPECGFIENLDEEIYHDLDHVSSHGVKEALRSPAHFYHKYVLKNRDTKKSKAKDFGKSVHAAFLEPQRFLQMNRVMPDYGDMRSTKNREKRDKWVANLSQGSIILTQAESDTIVGMAHALRSHPIASAMMEQIAGEISGFWVDSVTGLKCRMRIDGLITGKRLIIDYKTAEDASPKGFSKSAANYSYDIQAGHYVKGVQHILGEKFDYCFIAQEKEPPYCIGVYIPDDYFIEAGISLAMKGLLTLKECFAQNTWPSYSEDAVNLSLPMWRMMEVENT